MTRTLLPLTLLLGGCLATKSTVYMVKAEQALATANQVEAQKWAPYQWEQAQAFMVKAREEWGTSDSGAAEELALRVEQVSAQAAEVARQNQAKGVVPGSVLPERAKKLLTAPPGYRDGERAPAQPAQPAPAPSGAWSGQ